MARRPRLLDLFCGAGGAAVGYPRAGFDVVGVDTDGRQLEVYPFDCVNGDALNPPVDLSQFDAIHASPPCQRYSTATTGTGDPLSHPDLVEPVRQLLADSGLPTIMENVPGAPMRPDVMLCGSSFGLRVQRHRVFECGRWFAWGAPPCRHANQLQSGPVVTVTGWAEPNVRHRPGRSRPTSIKYTDVNHAREVMGMPWATRHGCVEAIPPAYTEWLGEQLFEHVTVCCGA